MQHELPPEQLRYRCDPGSLTFQTTSEIDCCDEIIGQPRALRAIKMGLEIRSPGYNVFVSGLTGTGKKTTIKHLLEQLEIEEKIPPDLCYVNNFKNPDAPILLQLPAGSGAKLAKDMDFLIGFLKEHIPQVFESEQFKEKRSEILDSIREKQDSLFKAFEAKVKEAGLALVQVQVGPLTRPEIVPLTEGNAVPWPKLEEAVEAGKTGDFTKEQFEQLKSKAVELTKEFEGILAKSRELERELKEKARSLELDFVRPMVAGVIGELKLKYQTDKARLYLSAVEEDILENVQNFKTAPEGPGEGETAPPPSRQEPGRFRAYKVNVLVDNSSTKRPPIIIETTPSYSKLFGTIGRVSERSGVWRTDFTKIRAGSLVQANGGYIVFNVIDALAEQGLWNALKRALKNRQVTIEPLDPFFMVTTSTLKPEPIDIDVKVVVIGDDRTYRLLYQLDDEFRKIFKVKADFDMSMERSEETIRKYTQFMARICRDEGLLPLSKGGAARVIEYGVRLAGKKGKLSTKFSDVADAIREASYWAAKEGSKLIEAAHVQKAIDEKAFRSKLYEDKLQELIADGTIMLDIEGERVGQVNGLSVYDLGDYSFGKPSKITATVSLGRSGIVDIEREADLSGKTYNKAVLIIGGYLRGKYAHDKPLAMNASICFEQSYGGIDGDSASSTEVYAIISSLSGIPLRQDVAVTGSVNQKGEIQPIGGVNQKIEGFFDACKQKGLTGTQGVMIPSLNVPDLMLRSEIVSAVKEGKFHIYAVSTIDEGIEILTGREAGRRREDGTYPEGSVHYLAEKQLASMAAGLRSYLQTPDTGSGGF